MGSEYNNPAKRHFDITMSKRTRKPLNLEFEHGSYYNPPNLKGVSDGQGEVDGDVKTIDHQSLKQLINGDQKPKVNKGEERKSGGRNSLGEHFTEEEKELQLVSMQQQNSVQGLKFRGMVNRYVRALSHLIKVKCKGSRNKKPPLRLTV